MSRNGYPDVDVAPNSVGIGADFVGRLNQLFSPLLIDPCDSDRERGRKLTLPRAERSAASGLENQPRGDSAFSI
jgi:hypothetical protein